MKIKKTSIFSLILALAIVVGVTTAFATSAANTNEIDSNTPEGYVGAVLNELNNQEIGPNEVDSALGKLVAVNRGDENKFTAEEWEEILQKVESGDILFFDTIEEEVEYFQNK